MTEKRTVWPFRAVLTGAGPGLDAPSTAPPQLGGHRHDYNAMAAEIREAQGRVVHAQADLALREGALSDAREQLAAAQAAMKALCQQFAVACKELAIRPEDLTT